MKGLIFPFLLLGLCAFAETRVEKIDPVAEGELRLRPTFVSCGVTYGSSCPDLGIRYRKANSGEAWHTETRFPAFPEVANCRGSLLDLEEDTAYELQIVNLSTSQPLNPSTSFRTWKTDVPIAETRVIDPNTRDFPIVISAQGSPTGWIRYTLPEGTAITNISPAETLVVAGAKNVIVDGVTIHGGGNRPDRSSGHAVVVTNSVGVRFLNCDISNWGRVGTPRFEDTGRRHVTGLPTQGYGISGDAGIRIGKGAQEIVVERCFIHDPRGTASSWYYSHPAGQDAIVMATPDHSTVIRWCDLCGNENHRYDDVITSASNFDELGGFNRDADVYGNYLAFASDDICEFDGGQQNLRYFENRGEFCYVGLSLQGCMVSPPFVYRNLFSGLSDWFGLCGQTVKTGSNSGNNDGKDARLYVWNNVMMGRGSGMSMRPNLIEDVCNNILYDGAGVSDASKGAPGSIATNNVKRGASTDWTADPLFPVRALPFNFDRTRFTNVRVWDGRRMPYEVSGAFDIGAAVFRYDGPTGAVLTRPFTNTCPIAASTNAVETFDLRQDVTFAAPISSGCLPFVKTGPGRMVLRGESASTEFGFALGQPGTKYPKQGNFNKRFTLPETGLSPAQGFGMFTILQGGLRLVTGTVKVKQSSSYLMIGGWTAADGEQEPDVDLEVCRGSTFTTSSAPVLGCNHGFVSTTPDGPAAARLIIDGGTFDTASGVTFNLGSVVDAPSGQTLNSVVTLEVRNGGVFTRNSGTGTTNPFYVNQQKGQAARILVDGGRFSMWRMLIGGKAKANDETAAFDIAVTTGGLFDGDTLTNNTGNVECPPPVRVRVTNGGLFLVNDVQNRGSGRFSFEFDDGVVGCNTLSNRKVSPQRCHVIGPNMTSVAVGPGGMTVRARGQITSGVPLTAVVASPISAATTEVDCPVTIDADDENLVEFTAAATYEVPVKMRGGDLSLPAGMAVRFDVPEGETCTVSGRILGAGTIVKTGKGLLQFSRRVVAARLEIREGDVTLIDATSQIDEIDECGGHRHDAYESGVHYADRTAFGDWTVDVAAAHERVVAAQSGAGGIVKTGAGMLTLEAVNTFSGAVDIRIGALEVLKSIDNVSTIRISNGARLLAPSGTVFTVKEFAIDGYRVPRGTLTGEHCAALGEGVVLVIAEGEVPAPTKTATWTGAAGDKLMSTAANWDQKGLNLTDGSLGVTIGTAGSEMIPDAEPLVNSVTVSRAVTTPFVIGAAGKVLSVAGRIDLGAGADDTAQIVLRGRIQGPYGLDQGPATSGGPVLYSIAPTYTSASVPAGCVGGSTKSLPLILDNAEVAKPIFMRSAPSASSHTALMALRGTTNVISGNIAWPTPTGYITTDEGSELTLSGGVNATWGHTKTGSGTLRIVDKPYLCGYQLTQNGGCIVFDAEGCTFGGRTHTEGFVLSSGDKTPNRLEFARSGCFGTNTISFVLTGSGVSTIEMNSTVQRIGRLKGWGAANAACSVHGDYPARLEVTGGVRPGMESEMLAQVMMMTNSVQMTGCLSLAFLGDLAPQGNADYHGLNESLVLSGRDFESCGDLFVSGGTLELAADASWLNGTNFIACGRGVLKFNRDGQVASERACLWLDDEGRVEIPSGTTVTVWRVKFRDAVSGKWRIAQPKTYDGTETGPLHGRIFGGGRLSVIGPRGTCLYMLLK